MNRPATDQPAAFSARDIDLEIDGRRILNQVSLDFGSGEITSLVGHNGSGKSSLLKILARQNKATAGRVLCAGQELDGFSSRDFARKVGYLQQDLGAGSGMTVRELVACGRYPWHGALGRFSDIDRRKVEDALALTHIEPLADRPIETLSGGERQRAWIAMLMAQDTESLLLDEPTSALDIAHQIEVLSLVRRLSADRGLSVVIVLHDINMAARFSDRIHALKNGEVVASGTPADILQTATLRQIYGIDMDVTPHPSLNVPIAYVR